VKHFGHWTQWRIRVGTAASIRVLRIWRSARAESFPSLGGWSRLRFVNIDWVMEEGWTFADSHFYDCSSSPFSGTKNAEVHIVEWLETIQLLSPDPVRLCRKELDSAGSEFLEW